jgi:hypothetical protein
MVRTNNHGFKEASNYYQSRLIVDEEEEKVR